MITQLGSVLQTSCDMQICTVNLRNSNRKNVQISAALNKEHNLHLSVHWCSKVREI